MSQPPHPMAGAHGEGPPIAPANWKWRCGNRLRDMYFYSPEGKLFRSRTELASYLASLDDGPTPDQFCWRVTREIVDSGVWTKEEVSPKTPKTPKTLKTPKTKPKHVGAESPAKKVKQSDRGSIASPQIPSPSTAHNGVQFSQVEPLAIRKPDRGVSTKVIPSTVNPDKGVSKKVIPGTLTSRAKVKAKRGDTPKRAEAEKKPETPKKAEAPKKTEISYHSFKEILAEPSSFKWLFDTAAMEKFKEEARKLDELSAEEISEMRKLLVDRNPQMGNMSKYPNAALKVFLRLLGTNGLSAEPSETLGKVELVDLCMKLAKA